MRFVEAMVASLGIMCFGWLSIPVVGGISGVAITGVEGFKMSAYFFVLRVVWLYMVRLYFSRRENETCTEKRAFCECYNTTKGI